MKNYEKLSMLAHLNIRLEVIPMDFPVFDKYSNEK